MTIHSLQFILFSAAVLAVYYFLPRKGQNVLLLAASYVFYTSFSWHFSAILLVMTSANYLLGRQIERSGRAQPWLAAGIGVNVLVFLFFKASDFYVPEVHEFISNLGVQKQTGGLKIILPIGLSFYVLQAISYLVDLSRRQIKVSPDPLTFAVYLAYFPKLTAGPIERARTFLPKLLTPRRVDGNLLARSFTLLIVGLFRKIVIADTLLLAVPAGLFRDPGAFSSLELVSWMAAYLFGLYNDFCGYTNIVRGVSGFFGIELSRNFMHPMFSRNFSELWTRWHITLSLWLRDYVYFPVSRFLVRRSPGLKNPVNIIVPSVVTMLASGLWHGPRISYLSWGGIMGVYLAVENFIASRRPVVSPDKRPPWRQAGMMVLVSLLASCSVVVFLAGPVVAVDFFMSLFVNTRHVLPSSRVFLLIVPAFVLDYLQHRSRNEMVFLDHPIVLRALLLALAVLLITVFSQSKLETPFIYQGF